MKLFLDSASVSDLTEAASHSLISGVTTNPALVAKEPPHILGYYGQLRDLVRIVGPDTPISVQPSKADLAAPSLKERIGIIKGTMQTRHLIVKVAMSWDNLPLIRAISGLGVHVNVTCVFTADQAIAAINAGARYVSLFWCRINDAKSGQAGAATRLVRDLMTAAGSRSEIIAGSIRTPVDAYNAFHAGAHIVTTGLSVLKAMANSPLSDASAEGFEKARAEWDERSAAFSQQLESGTNVEQPV
jgi:transaldolase